MSLENLTAEERSTLELGRLLLSDPSTSKEARRLAKKLKPDLRFADLDLEDQLRSQQEANDKRWKDREEADRREKFERERAAAHARLRERNLDPAAVEKVMTEHGIASYEAAAELMEARAALAEPSPDEATPMDLPDNKELWKDPSKWARQTAFDTINEIRKKSRARA